MGLFRGLWGCLGGCGVVWGVVGLFRGLWGCLGVVGLFGGTEAVWGLKVCMSIGGFKKIFWKDF